MIIQQVSVKNLVTKSKIPGVDFVINPYIGCPHNCIYCYAEYMCRFSGHPEPWGSFVDVKRSLTPFKPAALFRQRVLLCSATDPYNLCEQEYLRTREILKQLIYAQARVSILTKSALVVRDIDLFKQLYQCEIGFSFSTADENVRKIMEPGASSIENRLKALQTLHQAGLPTVVMAAPLLPGISDWKALIQATQPFTTLYRFDQLNLRPGFQKKFISLIAAHYPHALPLYSEIYLRENQTYWQQLKKEIETYAHEQSLPVEVLF